MSFGSFKNLPTSDYCFVLQLFFFFFIFLSLVNRIDCSILVEKKLLVRVVSCDFPAVQRVYLGAVCWQCNSSFGYAKNISIIVRPKSEAFHLTVPMSNNLQRNVVLEVNLFISIHFAIMRKYIQIQTKARNNLFIFFSFQT